MGQLTAASIGANIKIGRTSAKLTQAILSERSGVNRTQIVKMETGQIIPQLDDAVRIADALHIPMELLITGKKWPRVDLRGIAHELYDLGVRDFVVSDASVPGAFRRAEQVVALALKGDRPEARVIEAMPYVLSKNRLHVRLALAFADLYDPRVKTRLAWLGDLALTLAKQDALTIDPEVERALERLTKSVAKPGAPDDLGNPGGGRLSPIWRRWNVTYSGTMNTFRERSQRLSADNPVRAGEKIRNSKGSPMRKVRANEGAHSPFPERPRRCSG